MSSLWQHMFSNSQGLGFPKLQLAEAQPSVPKRILLDHVHHDSLVAHDLVRLAALPGGLEGNRQSNHAHLRRGSNCEGEIELN